jgi:hypothetical protein
MAVENRGGPRPGPQNNPNNIDISGGRGQNPKNMELKYRGMGYGTTGQINATAQAAGGVAGTVGAATRLTPRAAMGGATATPVVPIGAETQFPEETIFSGSRVPGGADFAELDLPKQPVGDPDLDTVIAYYPIMRFWANQPDTPQATKDYVRYLGTIIPQ